jgi:hypothetical protein
MAKPAIETARGSVMSKTAMPLKRSRPTKA